MRALSTRSFTRQFSKVRHEPLTVTDRGDVVGTWTPAPKAPKKIDFEARLRRHFKTKLPFNIADIVKEGRKR